MFGLYFCFLLQELGYGTVNDSIMWNVAPILPQTGMQNGNADYYVSEEIRTDGENNDRFNISSMLNITVVGASPLKQGENILQLIKFCQNPSTLPDVNTLLNNYTQQAYKFTNIIINPVASQTFDGVTPAGRWITTLNIPVSYMIEKSSNE